VDDAGLRHVAVIMIGIGVVVLLMMTALGRQLGKSRQTDPPALVAACSGTRADSERVRCRPIRLRRSRDPGGQG
jgi:hypothetical protein